ncbi:MAG TPA: DUF5674 family protein [Candidatus Paceibacterota bacterium]
MGIVVVGEKLTKEEFFKAKKDYKTYVKITIDVESSAVLLGGEYHADTEKILLEAESR